MGNILNQIVNFFNRIEPVVLVLWVALVIVDKIFELDFYLLTIVSSCTLSAFYAMQGRVASHQLADKSFFIRAYPFVLGYASSMLMLGILFKVRHFPGASPMANVGMVGIFFSCFFLFYQPVQDEFLPVMKKILLRIFLLITTGLLVSL